ncbi:receptor protein kinase TMK1-like [Dendrobium catenatum]|uniref:receptor protein kinase TMK1-like n=1 Tax=Dendrobium catenatum TaxID=906689 RepID=UPI0010A04592|nr:receptor protein kinase TMK1-like [Dendrobium catenatum]
MAPEVISHLYADTQNVYDDDIRTWPILTILNLPTQDSNVDCGMFIGNQRLTGTIPKDIANLTALTRLDLQFNEISGDLPSLSSVASLSGGIAFVQSMTGLEELWLHSNSFSGPLPDFSGLVNVQSMTMSKAFLHYELQNKSCK